MLRQKNIFSNRPISFKPKQTEFINSNTVNSYIDKQNGLQKKSILPENRMGLAQLSSNHNVMSSKDSVLYKILGNDNKFKPQSKPKCNTNIFVKISQLIKNEDIPIPICHSNKNKPLISVRQRPNTSFTREQKAGFDQSQFNKFSVVLNLSKNQQQVRMPERVSTSRALMNYSKVYRNSSNQGFRVKKQANISNRFVHLSAQKITFHQKQKKEKKDYFQKTAVDRGSIFKRFKKTQKVKQRYDEQQNFQLGGWEYID